MKKKMISKEKKKQNYNLKFVVLMFLKSMVLRTLIYR